MTIALGFLHQEGALLCADTELTGTDDRKQHASKLFHFNSAVGYFGFVFAGNVANAVGTLQRIKKRLLLTRSSDPMSVVASVHEIEYTRLVLARPKDERDDMAFQFIIAFKPPKGDVQMYVTEGIQVWDAGREVAIGIGAPLAMQLLEGPIRIGVVTRGDFLTVGAYVLGAVKDQMTQCGGASFFIDIGHNGSLTELYDDRYLKAIEQWFRVYHMLTWGLFARLGDASQTENDFIANLKGFSEKLIVQRREWNQLREHHLQRREFFQHIHRSRARQVQKSPKRDRKGRTP